jgi:hypothetical protein
MKYAVCCTCTAGCNNRRLTRQWLTNVTKKHMLPGCTGHRDVRNRPAATASTGPVVTSWYCRHAHQARRAVHVVKHLYLQRCCRYLQSLPVHTIGNTLTKPEGLSMLCSTSIFSAAAACAASAAAFSDEASLWSCCAALRSPAAVAADAL